MDDLGDVHYARALRAYYRGASTGNVPTSPDPAYSGAVTLADGKQYIRLATRERILAIYRVRPHGILRRMKRWPKVLEAV